LIVF
jgi:hypothetical protein